MTKRKIEKLIFISCIGLLICIVMGFGSRHIKSNLAGNTTNQSDDADRILDKIQDDFLAGHISKKAYDSLIEAANTTEFRAGINADLNNANIEILPAWVTALGISEPQGMKKDPVLSNFTSKENPSEGFNSVSLVYKGSYDIAVEEAAHMAANAKLYKARSYRAIGGHLRKVTEQPNPVVTYLNYDLESKDQKYLISIQVDPTGKMSVIVTDNVQLNERLLSYAPLNNRSKSNIKAKK